MSLKEIHCDRICQNCVRQGCLNLKKRPNKMMSFSPFAQKHRKAGKDYYVVLADGKLYFFKTEHNRPCAEVVSLIGYNKVKRQERSEKEWHLFPFSIIYAIESSDDKDYHFAASSEDDQRNWILAIREEILKVHQDKWSGLMKNRKSLLDLEEEDVFEPNEEFRKDPHVQYLRNYDQISRISSDTGYSDRSMCSGFDSDSDGDDYEKPTDIGTPPKPPPPRRPQKPGHLHVKQGSIDKPLVLPPQPKLHLPKPPNGIDFTSPFNQPTHSPRSECSVNQRLRLPTEHQKPSLPGSMHKAPTVLERYHDTEEEEGDEEEEEEEEEDAYKNVQNNNHVTPIKKPASELELYLIGDPTRPLGQGSPSSPKIKPPVAPKPEQRSPFLQHDQATLAQQAAAMIKVRQTTRNIPEVYDDSEGEENDEYDKQSNSRPVTPTSEDNEDPIYPITPPPELTDDPVCPITPPEKKFHAPMYPSAPPRGPDGEEEEEEDEDGHEYESAIGDYETPPRKPPTPPPVPSSSRPVVPLARRPLPAPPPPGTIEGRPSPPPARPRKPIQHCEPMERKIFYHDVQNGEYAVDVIRRCTDKGVYLVRMSSDNGHYVLVVSTGTTSIYHIKTVNYDGGSIGLRPENGASPSEKFKDIFELVEYYQTHDIQILSDSSSFRLVRPHPAATYRLKKPTQRR